MTTAPSSRILGAAIIAWVAVLAVAFIAGCAYPALLARSVGRSLHISADMVSFCFLLGVTFAGIAAPVAALVGLGIGIPLFRLMRHSGYWSPAAHLVAGLLLSTLAAAMLSLAHFKIDFLGAYDFTYSIYTVAIAGPIAGLVVWKFAYGTRRHLTNAWSGLES